MAVYKCNQCGEIIESRCKPGKCSACGAAKDDLIKQEAVKRESCKKTRCSKASKEE